MGLNKFYFCEGVGSVELCKVTKVTLGVFTKLRRQNTCMQLCEEIIIISVMCLANNNNNNNKFICNENT